MGVQKCRCRECGALIKASCSFGLLLAQAYHVERRHPQIWISNKKVNEIYARKLKRLNDWLINHERIIFGPSKWDGEDSL